MKKILLSILLLFLAFTNSMLMSRPNMQIVEISVCEESIILAELLAKAKVNRKQLYSVSYCTCEGMDSSYRTDQTIGDCKSPKDRVYSCNCIGRTDY